MKIEIIERVGEDRKFDESEADGAIGRAALRLLQEIAERPRHHQSQRNYGYDLVLLLMRRIHENEPGEYYAKGKLLDLAINLTGSFGPSMCPRDNEISDDNLRF